EELLGIGILEGAKSKGLSTLLSSLLSAVVFALLHVPAYWDGSLFSTLLHVLLLQGFARLLLNYVYLKTGRSIWGSWVTHLIIDLIALSVAVQ
ncbi:MAG: CPBP family intramembrane metalloprotease, partial [Exiguobacterium sp.]|nr:CPBP family intramembrane metalloprotease [Exiguobacterium sp.]